MNPVDQVVPLRREDIFHVQAAQSAMNRFAGIELPQNPWMAPNNFSSPHQDSWCSESVSLDGPTEKKLLLTEQWNPFGFTPIMVCNRQNQMIGVSLEYPNQYWLVVFDEDCHILSATPAGKRTENTFGGGYFYLDNKDNSITVQENRIVSYPTQNVRPKKDEIYPLEPNWTSADIIELVTGSPDGNSLYSCLPVWNAERPNLYWCLISGKYNYQDYPDSTLTSPAYMAVIEVVPEGDGNCRTVLIDSLKLDKQWNNNTFAVDKSGAYIVTNGIDDNNQCNQGYLWAFGLEGNKLIVRWKTAYENAGYQKPGQTNIGSGTTPTLTATEDGTELVAITDNADPRLHVVVCNRRDGSLVAQVPCFEKMRSADEASLIGVQDTFVAENNFGHYPTWPFSQYVPNSPGMEMIQVYPDHGNKRADEIWDQADVHFYAMSMLCRESGIIFAHTCDWTTDISATKGGMYYISALDSFNGRVIWRIPLGRGLNYCHEYGGIYFNHNGDLFMGTNQFLISIKNFHNRSKKMKEDVRKVGESTKPTYE